MALVRLRSALNVTLALLAVTAALGAGSSTAFGGVSSAAIVVMLAQLRRDPSGAAAVPTEPWGRAAEAPSGLVPLMPGVGIRMPTVLPLRPRRDPIRVRLPRRTARAIAFMLVALAVAITVLPPQLRQDCSSLLSMLHPSTCSWHTDITREGVAALSALFLSAVYAAQTLWRAR